MNEPKTCRMETIAVGKFCSITLCSDCQLYNLHVGPMSFRMDPEIFQGLCEMIFDHCLRQNPIIEKNLHTIQKH